VREQGRALALSARPRLTVHLNTHDLRRVIDNSSHHQGSTTRDKWFSAELMGSKADLASTARTCWQVITAGSKDASLALFVNYHPRRRRLHSTRADSVRPWECDGSGVV